MIRFFAAGTPAPQGSKRIVPTGAGARLIEANDPKKKAWRSEVGDAITAWKEARPEVAAACPLDGSLILDVIFYFHRPASISAKKRPWPSVKPDVDKLARSIMDVAKINGLIADDCRVVKLVASKVYRSDGGRTGADVYIAPYEVEPIPAYTREPT